MKDKSITPYEITLEDFFENSKQSHTHSQALTEIKKGVTPHVIEIKYKDIHYKGSFNPNIYPFDYFKSDSFMEGIFKFYFYPRLTLNNQNY